MVRQDAVRNRVRRLEIDVTLQDARARVGFMPCAERACVGTQRTSIGAVLARGEKEQCVRQLRIAQTTRQASG